MDLEPAWWPQFHIRVRTPRIELRPLTDDDLGALCRIIAGGLHPPDEMPFSFPWTEAPVPELQRSSLQFHWRTRAEWTPESWRLPFGVWEDGELVGQQDVAANGFAVRRTVESGSFLSLPKQGRGIGKEMRSAMLHFAFAGLGAVRAETEAFADNPASQAVTRSQGYLPNGESTFARKGESVRMLRFALDRDAWEAGRRDDIAIEGLDGALEVFGA